MTMTQDIVGYSHDGGHTNRVGEDRAVMVRRALAKLGPSGRASLALAWRFQMQRGAARSNVGNIFDDGLGFVKSAGKALGKAGKAIARSPITKIATGALIIVAPEIGLPLAAGLAVANKVLDAAETPPTPGAPPAVQAVQAKRQLAAKNVVKATLREAHKGHRGAQAAVRDLKIAARERRAAPKHLRAPHLRGAPSFKGVLVLRDGTLVKGIYRKA